MSCQQGYSNCDCNDVAPGFAYGAGPMLKEVEDQIERTLDKHETMELIKMIRCGFATRQLITKVKELEAYQIANARREIYVAKLKEMGTTLSGAEMIKFKHDADVKDGVHKEWEKIGYPAYYRSGLLEEIEAAKQKAKKQKQAKKEKETKKAAKELKKASKKKTKKSSMEEVD